MSGLYEVFNAAGPAFLNNLTTKNLFDGRWAFVATAAPALWEQPWLPAAFP